jgi:hypothetical protein
MLPLFLCHASQGFCVNVIVYTVSFFFNPISFQDLRRDLQAVIGTRANFNIAQIENYGGETFLSEEVAIALLQESKLAFRRCELVGIMSGH